VNPNPLQDKDPRLFSPGMGNFPEQNCNGKRGLLLALWSLASNFFCLKTYIIQIRRVVMSSSLFPAEHNKVVVLMVYAKSGQGISSCPPHAASKTGHCNTRQSRDIFLEKKNSQNMDFLGLQCHTMDLGELEISAFHQNPRRVVLLP